MSQRSNHKVNSKWKKKYVETNEKIHSMPKLTDCSKGVLGEKFISISTYIKK